MPYYAAPADAGLVSKDGHSAQVLISLAGESQDDYLSNYDELAPTLEAPESTGLDTDLAGAFAVYDDVNEITSEDLARPRRSRCPIVLAARAADLRQPRRRLDAGPGRAARHGRRAGRWSG